MPLLCPCGFDCSDFIAHHQISVDAQFNCPVCDGTLRPGSLPSLELTLEPPTLRSAESAPAAGAAPPS